MTTTQNSAHAILTRLALVLANEDSDPDDLIYAFGDVEAHRTEIARLLTQLLGNRSHQQNSP